MDDVTALDVEDQTEVFTGLVDLDNVHETGGELGIGTDLAINLDQALFQDGFHFLGGQCVLQTVTQENG